jgi:hypothetical protein
MCRAVAGMSVAAALAELIDEAATVMQGQSGGQSVCALTKAGKSVPGLKYAEGRWAALREVRSKADSDAETPPVVAAVTAAWVGHLDRLQIRGAGVDWIAYRSGGIDALAELAEALGCGDGKQPQASKLIGP